MMFIAQAIGMAGLLLNVLSYQRKTKRAIITTQLISASIFCIHFLMLEETTGCILNLIAAARAVVYTNKETFKSDKKIWLGFFSLLYFTTYALAFLVFKKEPTVNNLLVELLPVCAMVFSNLAFMTKNAAMVRRLSFFSSPLWLIYNVFAFSISGILCEVFCLVSILIGIIRFDLKKDNIKNSQTEEKSC